MTAGNYDFFIEKDRNLSKVMQIFDEITGNTFDLTDYSIKMQIRSAAGSSTVLYTFSSITGNIVITNATQGIFTFNLTPTQSAALTFTKGVYDLIFITSLGVVTEILEGYVNVLPAITSST